MRTGLIIILVTLMSFSLNAQDIAKQAGTVVAGTVAGAAANAAVAKIFDTPCKKAETAHWACPIVGSSLMQVATLMATQSKTSDSKSKITAGSGNFNDGFNKPTTPGETKDNNPDKELELEISKQLAKLAEKGYTVNPKTGEVTTPKGKFPSSAFANGKSMADAGIISPDQISDVDIMIKKSLDSAYKVVSIGIAGGGGGGSSSGSSRSSSYEYQDPYKNLYGEREKPNDPRTAGLTRNLASGDSVGASTDNLFEMIKRRYQEKSKEKIFVGQ